MTGLFMFLKQITPEQALEVLENKELQQALQSLQSHVKIGASISHQVTIENALEKGIIDWFDVIQLPAWIIRKNPNILPQLMDRNIEVVLNSPVRHLSPNQSPSQSYHELLQMKGISIVLSGSRHHLEETLNFAKN